MYASSNPMHGISKHQGLKQFEWDANPPTAHKESDDVDSLARRPKSAHQHTTTAKNKRKANDGASSERSGPKRNHGSRTNAIAGGVLHQEARHCCHRTGEQVRVVLRYPCAARRGAADACGLRISAHIVLHDVFGWWWEHGTTKSPE